MQGSDDYVKQRLRNWGRWKAGASAGGLGFASTNWDGFDAGDGYSTAAPVMPEGEEAITDQAVRSLPKDLYDCCEMQYVKGGGTAQKAQRLGCAENTFYIRLRSVHGQVGAWLSNRKRLQDEERARVEALQRAAHGEFSSR